MIYMYLIAMALTTMVYCLALYPIWYFFRKKEYPLFSSWLLK